MRRLTATWWLASLIGTAGCSSSDSKEKSEPVASTEPEADNDFLIGEDGDLPGGSGTVDDRGAQCLGETRQAEAIGLDIYVMLDISGSMLEPLPLRSLFQTTSTTKWDAVQSSFQAFVQAPATADIGVGMQYFPQLKVDVPALCSSNQECGIGGPCSSSACVANFIFDDPADNTPAVRFIGAPRDDLCASDADCTGQGETCRSMLGACVIPGVDVPPLPLLPLCNAATDCAGVPGTECEQIRACELLSQDQIVPCTDSIACPPGFGACVPFPYVCLGQTSCEVSGYATPAVPISSAATRTPALVASLQSQVPRGRTPTGPALSGALEHARLWAEQNPGRQVVTVLATDGLPTDCAPTEIPEIAQLASDANSGDYPVRTFVIGVFSAADLGDDGQQRLDTIARAGGTERAFVINTGGNVADEFLNALNQIRDTTVSCEFQLDAGAELDFDRVNLRVSDAAGNVNDLLNVGDASACGGDQGWYYVRNATGNPTQITVCPSTCAGFMAEGIRAELEIGCATRIR